MKKIVLFFIAVISFAQLHAQDSAKTIKSVLDAKRYSFVPQTMMPMKGKTRHVNDGSFSLDVKGDSLVVYLPYIGEAYSAPIGSGEAGYNFTSTDYTYTVKEGKKNRYEVSIKVNDKFSGTEFNLTVFDNKSASLYARSSSKQGISYNGDIVEKK